MAKKSRKTAAKYSELSKAGKRKQQRIRAPAHIGTVSVPTSQETAERRPARTPVAQAAPRAQTALKRGISGYEYVRADLKKIAILSGAMIVILIVLAFVLG